ncbi:Diaminopimelate epimerase-like protein [Ophiobolus disseminans]|uniref:Diaminopimelate epimerase-like protein n=1 Tax=Ophiobolus disseminans TaxID=1469910 RepID=A0A6A6ZGC0_9PLEO|nr:Diaminopimelate epimerase-like protein [Ophiobolus disseminans]
MSSPSQLDFVTVDVFTAKQYEGNPLAIIRIPNGVVISQEQKQTIAREFNLSEATFLHENDAHAQEDTWTVDIFLTTAEIPFAGHPTIGTACYVLARAAQERGIQDGVIEGGFKLKAGPVDLRYDISKKTARAAIPHDVLLQSRLADAHQNNKIQVQDDFAVVSIVKGMTFVLVEVESLEALKLVSLAGRSVVIDGLDKGWDRTFIGMYFFVRMGKSSEAAVSLRTRMIEGPLEDPATGSAASALTAYLSLKEGNANETLRYELVQGVEMGRRSEILIDIQMNNDKSISKVFLEGAAVQVMDGRVSI